ncbi:MAG: fumarylacetoacetate hydrolase family protein [Bacteroidetes bacterium]|nr:fumarylacetoacetate hydrolase family protein [Bacteroidota bacterium]
MKTVIIKNLGYTFNVSKILCIGQNYAEHAKELNFEIPRSPVFFLKPITALTSSGTKVVLPSISSNVHYEVELVVVLGKGGKMIPESDALEYIAGYGVGLDMTMRDVQSEAKQKGLPWTLAKGFDTSAPISEFIPREEVPHVEDLRVELSVNGVVRQRGVCKDMIFPVGRCLSYISQFITLEPGDLLFTGTPPGVGPVFQNDILEGRLILNGKTLTTVTVTATREYP